MSWAVLACTRCGVTVHETMLATHDESHASGYKSPAAENPAPDGVWLVWFAIDCLEGVCRTETEAKALVRQLAEDGWPAEYLEIQFRAWGGSDD